MKEEKDFRTIFENYSVGKALATMALPTIAGQIITLIYNIADTFFIGQTNNPYMVAGCSLILPLFNMTIPLCNIFSIGGGTLISNLLGKDKLEDAKNVSAFSIYFSILFSGLFALLIFLNLENILFLFGVTDKIYEYSKTYATIVLCMGAIPIVVSNVMAGILRSIGHSKLAGTGIMLGGILNIILDPIFMFLIFIGGREVYGVAYATLISNIISLIYFIIAVIYVNKKTGLISFNIKRIRIKRTLCLRLFAIGAASAITPFLFDIDYVVLDKLMAAHGELPLAAIGIVVKIMRLPINTCLGLCLGMMPLLAYNIAQNNYKRFKSIAKTALISGIIFSVVSISLYEIFAKQLIYLFIKEAETLNYGINFLRAQSPASLFMFLCFYMPYYYQGKGNGTMAILLGTFRWLIVNIPMLYLLDKLFGINGLAFSQLISDSIVATISMILFIYEMRRMNKRIN